MKQYYYILKDNVAVPVHFDEWCSWYSSHQDKHVGHDKIGDVYVSTVFLSMDHNYFEGEPPALFETMVFGGPLDGEMERYSTYDEAVEGHKRMVERVREL
jgi:hypothetical protein